MASFPDIASIELFDDGIPHDLLARIRHESPVWIPEPASERFGGGPGYWAVCRHADINHVVQNPQIYSSWLGGTTVREARPQDLEVFRLMMLNTDPPKHSKMRKIVNRAFTPQVINQLKDSIEAHARGVIDAVCERGEVDFLENVAAEMPLLVLADILGVPAQDRHLLFDWTNTLVAFDDPDSGIAPETFRAKVLEMFAYASARTLEKRAKPGNDVWSLIVNAEVDGERLSKGQLDRFFQLLMIAGNETTRNLIAHGMHLLSTHPEQRRKLMADMSLLPAAIEEMLRFSPPITQFRRTAAVDTELNGRFIKAGDKVLICFAAANRDEAVFDRPDEFDITRKPSPHLSFGGGTHFCLGANLARLEARVLFTELLTRLPDIEVNGPVVRARSNFVNGLLHLPVKFTPTLPRGRAARQPAAGLPDPGHVHPAVAAAAPAVPAHGTSMLVLYGSNFGTAEDVARKLADDAKGYGFTVNVAELDEYAGQLPEEGYVLVVCATYNGTPPDNARKFVEWVEGSDESLAKVRYSVFGCGNSDWAATFQEVPRRIDRALSRRGATRVHAQGEGDAKDDFDGRFEAWVQPMWEKLASELGIELAAPAAEPLFSVEVLKRERVSPFVDSLGARPMPVAENRELRSREGGSAGVGSTRHIEFDLPEGVRYVAGDHLGVVPHNARALVERAAARLGFEQDATIRITARSDRKTFLPVGERMTLSTLLADYVELQHVATRAQVRTLAAHSRCPFTKVNLEALAVDGSAGGGEGLYRSEVLAKRRSVLDLLEQFPAVKLPLEVYLEMLPPLSPRYYSISSSSLKSERRCSITVGAVSGPAKSGRGEFAGVCSSYLAGQGPGAVLYAFVKDTKSAFRLPADPGTPIIMVGPGTGLAPFRGFLQERAELRAAGREVGPSMLFFGCRHPQQDYIYRDELEEFARSGVAELHVAFSRLQDRKVYVQDLLREQRERVWTLLRQGAVVYVCGDASRMEPDVRAAMVGIAVACGGMDETAARAHVEGLATTGRYVVDVWAAN